MSQALVIRPATGEEFRLDLRFLHMVTDGEEFEAHAGAVLGARGTAAVGEPRRAPVMTPTGEPPIEALYYRAGDTVRCDSTHIVKGAPGRILWSMRADRSRAPRAAARTPRR